MGVSARPVRSATSGGRGGPPSGEDGILRRRLEELASAETSAGTIRLRRRWDPSAGADVFEVQLGDEFLMSSLFTAAEVELARLALSRLPGSDLDVVVGGLGLGYTARAVLDDPRVRSLVIVEAFGEVIRWHELGLLPDAAELASDPRTRLVEDDFFALAAEDAGFDPSVPSRRFHAVLVDIDHTPSHVLRPSHAGFYTADGLRRLARHMEPGAVFALWSNDPPDTAFLAVLEEVFVDCDAVVVGFPNVYTGAESSNTVYVASVRRRPP